MSGAPRLTAPAVLSPAPEQAGQCPRDGRALEVARIHQPGWRTSVEGVCPDCGHRYLQDLPHGYGVLTPTTLDLDTGETFDPSGAAWFSRWLARSWQWPDEAPVDVEIAGSASGGRALLLNCLEPVYGHSLFRLLAADPLSRQADGATTIALVPRALAHLVPAAIDERWIVEGPIGRLGGWLLDLERTLTDEVARFDEVRLVAAPVNLHPSAFDIEAFVGRIEPERPGEPSIALSLRDDRAWGTDARDQARRVAGLVDAIRDGFPEAAFTAVGPGEPGGFPAGVADLRRPRPATEDEERWVAILRGADLTIGVHGSNIILASALARATMELLPRSRFPNHLMATIVQQTEPLLALNHHRVLYGDDDLADLTPQRVADVAITTLDDLDRFEQYTVGTGGGFGLTPLPPSRGWVRPDPPPTRRERARARGRTLAGLPRRAATRLRPPEPPEQRLHAALGPDVVRIDAAHEDAVARLAGLGDVRAVLVEGLRGDAGAVFERIEALGLSAYGLDDGTLVRTRPLGPLRERTLVLGATPEVVAALAPRLRGS